MTKLPKAGRHRHPCCRPLPEYQLDFRSLGGKVRPTKLVLTDALTKGAESTLEYSNLKLRELPDQIFTKEYLRRLD